MPTLIGKLNNLLRVPIMKSDVLPVRRIRGVPGRITSLVIQFTNRQLRDAIAEASRRARLTSYDFLSGYTEGTGLYKRAFDLFL